jgi:hypothetical protein
MWWSVLVCKHTHYTRKGQVIFLISRSLFFGKWRKEWVYATPGQFGFKVDLHVLGQIQAGLFN